jgi:Lipase (class 3)
MLNGQDIVARARTKARTRPYKQDRERTAPPTDVALLSAMATLPLSAVDKPNYDAVVAYLMAVASGWAYADEDAMALVLSKYALSDVKVDSVAINNGAMLVDVEAYIVTAKQAERRIGMVCFRGTEFGGPELTDAFTDANAVLVPNRGIAAGGTRPGHVHKGFHRSALYIWDYLKRAIDSAFYENGELTLDSLYVTGHSLGAAIAVIFAENIYNEPSLAALKSKLRGVYTYGQPRAGDEAYAKAAIETGFDKLVFRHVYGADWVPALPPASTGAYEHFGQALVSTPNGWEMSELKTLRALTITGSGLLAAGAFLGQRFVVGRWLMRLLQVKFSLEDHLPDHYVEASWRSLPQP